MYSIVVDPKNRARTTKNAMKDAKTDYVGRATIASPPNRFEQLTCELDLEQTCEDASSSKSGAREKIRTQFFDDQTSSLIQSNNSPDLPFGFSINPYRGCEHGCAYCYARPGHEYLGMNAGIDFESKILVKRDAAAVLRRELCRKGWIGQWIAVSGVTDCYQPAERHFQITRQCLEVFLEARQPFGIVTKNALVARDIDLLVRAAKRNLVHVYISITSLDASLLRRLEPRTSSPRARLRAVTRLAEYGIPVGVMVSPIIPGLNDEDIPRILEAVADAGAESAHFTLLRLPLSVRPVFMDWLAANFPEHRDRIESRIRSCRDGQLTSSEFGDRMRGRGPYAQNIHSTFRAFAHKYGLAKPLRKLDQRHFRPPRHPQGQKWLF